MAPSILDASQLETGGVVRALRDTIKWLGIYKLEFPTHSLDHPVSHGNLVETHRPPGTSGCRRRRRGQPCHSRRLPWVQSDERQEFWVNPDCRSLPRWQGLQCIWDRRPAAATSGDLRDRYDHLIKAEEKRAHADDLSILRHSDPRQDHGSGRQPV